MKAVALIHVVVNSEITRQPRPQPIAISASINSSSYQLPNYAERAQYCG